MKPTSSKQSVQQKQFICVYGPSGIGKTTLIKTLPGKVLVLDAENGMKHVSSDLVDKISLAIDDSGKLVPHEKRFDRLIEFMKYISTPECMSTYKTIVIDSFTEVSQIIFRSMEHTHGKDGFKKYDEYGKAIVDFIKFFRDSQAYDCVFIALEDRVDEDENTHQFVPSVQWAKIRSQAPAIFDAVVRMRVGRDDKREFICQSTARTLAKVRAKVKVQDIEPADLGMLFAKMKE